MLAMGASAVAFSPARFVLLGEGATEAILLPSLFRSALSGSSDAPLGFQVACGTSQVPADFAASFETEAGNVAYLFDADNGGTNHAGKIAQRAHDDGRVFVLGNGTEPGLCTEDLIGRDVYARAVSEVLRDTRNTSDAIAPSELPLVGRPTYVAAWCRTRGIAPLSKVRVAERVLRLSSNTHPLLEPARQDLVAELCRDVRLALAK
jgi:predicted ATP-dependent endonuclease of OLD family